MEKYPWNNSRVVSSNLCLCSYLASEPEYGCVHNSSTCCFVVQRTGDISKQCAGHAPCCRRACVILYRVLDIINLIRLFFCGKGWGAYYCFELNSTFFKIWLIIFYIIWVHLFLSRVHSFWSLGVLVHA